MRLSEDQYKLSKQNQNLSLEELAEILQALNLSQHAEIVGKWLWLTFKDKPDDAVILDIKILGFQYSEKRQAWLHRCGNPHTRRSPRDPRAKYGVKKLESEE